MRAVLILMLACLPVILFPQAPALAGTSDDIAATSVNEFAVDVYKELSAEKGNIFFSPYSVSSALAMTYAGARGGTASEMADVLRFAGRGERIHAAMRSLRERLEAVPEEMGSIDAANRLWVDGGEKLTPLFRLVTMENYAAGVGAADFERDYESERVKINDWAAEATGGKIKDLLKKGSVTPDTKLVLANAIYFKSAWREPFDVAFTAEEPFRSGGDQRENVPMMSRTGRYLYGENAEAQWIKIPYKAPGFSMMIILPVENESFTQMDALEKNLARGAISSWAGEMKSARVALTIPKFRDEREYSLADTLEKMGMKLAFSEDADFSGMVEEPRKNGYALHIDFVAHKAFIELDEKGTEAAAATAVGMVRMTANIDSPSSPPIVFNANHPFIYCVTDDQTGAILFMGRMEKP